MTGPTEFHSIFARNCEVRRIDKTVAAAFLDANHLYGDAQCRYRYGLFVKRHTGDSEAAFETQTLVAVATFSNARVWTKEGKPWHSYQWIRYASLKGTRVIGGMSKLLGTFIEELAPDDIMTYAPAEHFSGEVYTSLGFVQEESKVFQGGAQSLKFRLTVQKNGKEK